MFIATLFLWGKGEGEKLGIKRVLTNRRAEYIVEHQQNEALKRQIGKTQIDLEEFPWGVILAEI